MDPVTNPEIYETILLAGRKSPGQCKFTTIPKRPTKWSIAPAQGKLGGDVRLIGGPPAEFECSFFLWIEDGVSNFPEWDDWKPLLSESERTGKAIDIYHPYLAGLDPPIRSVVVQEKSEPIADGKGGATATVKFLENRTFVDVKGSGKVNGSRAGGGAPRDKTAKGTDPNQDLKDEVAALTAEFKNG